MAGLFGSDWQIPLLRNIESIKRPIPLTSVPSSCTSPRRQIAQRPGRVIRGPSISTTNTKSNGFSHNSSSSTAAAVTAPTHLNQIEEFPLQAQKMPFVLGNNSRSFIQNKSFIEGNSKFSSSNVKQLIHDEKKKEKPAFRVLHLQQQFQFQKETRENVKKEAKENTNLSIEINNFEKDPPNDFFSKEQQSNHISQQNSPRSPLFQQLTEWSKEEKIDNKVKQIQCNSSKRKIKVALREDEEELNEDDEELENQKQEYNPTTASCSGKDIISFIQEEQDCQQLSESNITDQKLNCTIRSMKIANISKETNKKQKHSLLRSQSANKPSCSSKGKKTLKKNGTIVIGGNQQLEEEKDEEFPDLSGQIPENPDSQYDDPLNFEEEMVEEEGDEAIKSTKQVILLKSIYKDRPATIFFEYPDCCEKKRRKGQRTQIVDLEESLKWQLTYRMNDCNRPYQCVTRSFESAGFVETKSATQWNGYWASNRISFVKKLNSEQRVNHYSGCWNLGRKDMLWMQLSKQRRRFPLEYNFLPRTFLLQSEWDRFQSLLETNPNQLWIVKPVASCCGKGIKVVSKTCKISAKYRKNYLASEYVSRPHLINGFKYDLRIYVLVSSYDPLRVYVFQEGLARFATEKYNLNSNGHQSHRLMHLTNYSVNKGGANFIKNTNSTEGQSGSKWALSAWKQYMATSIGKEKFQEVMEKINSIIVKTAIAVEPFMNEGKFHKHRKNCFELYGFDVLLDDKLSPWLLEVNVCPSLSSSSPLDRKIKTTLISDILNLLGFIPYIKSKKTKKNNLKRPSTAKIKPSSKDIEVKQKLLSNTMIKNGKESSQYATESSEQNEVATMQESFKTHLSEVKSIQRPLTAYPSSTQNSQRITSSTLFQDDIKINNLTMNTSGGSLSKSQALKNNNFVSVVKVQLTDSLAQQSGQQIQTEECKLLKKTKKNVRDLSDLSEYNCLQKLSQDDWEVLFECDEEFYRKGHFDRVFPPEDLQKLDSYSSLFLFPRFHNIMFWQLLKSPTNFLEQVSLKIYDISC